MTAFSPMCANPISRTRILISYRSRTVWAIMLYPRFMCNGRSPLSQRPINHAKCAIYCKTEFEIVPIYYISYIRPAAVCVCAAKSYQSLPKEIIKDRLPVVRCRGGFVIYGRFRNWMRDSTEAFVRFGFVLVFFISLWFGFWCRSGNVCDCSFR